VAGELAGLYTAGVAFVDLSPVSDPALPATAIAAALGLAPPTASSAEAYLTGWLRDKNLLLVLDNLEQLAAAATLLTRVLAAAPRLTILATSRVALHLTGEHLLQVPPLGLPEDDSAGSVLGSEAVRLFLARARAARGTFVPDAGEIGAICAAVDGLPLAIELAAAKLRLHSPQDLLPLLTARLTLLAGGPRDAPRRQQTLRAALDWSYQLLPAQDGLAALRQSRDQPLADTIASALSTAPAPGISQIRAALEGGSDQYSQDRV
jgi:predicted ATPase